MKNNKAFVILSILLLFSMSCSLLTLVQKKPQQSAGQPGENQPAAPATADDGVEAKIAEGEFTPIKVDLPSLSKVSFTPDASKTASVDFPADDNDVTLELTDSAGLTWRLFVPSIALGQPVTLKMTALKDIKSDDLLIEYQGGILLEPDGLQFRTPATLTVSGNGLKDELVFLTGAQDGSAMNLTLSGEDKNSAQIEHFSSLVATGRESLREQASLEGIEKQLSQHEKETVAMAEKFLKEHKSDLEVPVPPSIPIECSDSSKSGESDPRIDKFINDALEPEGVLIRALLTIEKGKALTGQESNPATPLVLRLMSRLEKKANLLLKTYRGQPEKVLSVAIFAITVAKQKALLGASENESAFLEYLGDWIAASLDKIIREIVEQHDYRKYQAAWTVAKWASLLSDKSIAFEKFIDRISAAMRFDLQATLKYTTMDSIWDLQAKIPMYITLEPNVVTWQGNGTGSIEYSYTGKGSATATTHPFTVNAFITHFDVCEGKGEISIDRFFGDPETMNVEDQKVTAPYTKNAWEFSFANYKGANAVLTVLAKAPSGYIFPFTIHNLDVNAADESVEGDTKCGNKCSVNFDFKLIHTPKYLK